MTPMLKQYFEVKKQHKDAVLFFQMGDFYEMFGDDAIEAAKILDVTLTARGKGTENEIAMCGAPVKAGEAYIAKLTKAGKKVAVCDQLTPPDGKGVVKREVTKIVTPGTTFDDGILSQKEANYLCALESENGQYALGFIDVTTGLFQVALFDSEEVLLDELSRIKPAEMIVSTEQSVLAPFENDLYIANFSLPVWQDPKKLLTEHFQTAGLEAFGIEQEPLLIKVAAQLLAYVQETQRGSLGHIRSIERYQPDEYMMLDEATIRNLELFSNQQTGQTEGSLIGVLDETTTSMGGRLLRWWLAHPLIKREDIEARLEAVDAFVRDPNFCEQIRDQLSGISDLERLVGKTGTMRVNPRDLSNLKDSLRRIPQLKEDLSKLAQKSQLLASINEQLDPHEKLVEHIETVLADDPPILLQEGGYIREGYSGELDELRSMATSGKEWVNGLQEKERERTEIQSLKVKFNKVFGYYIEISKANLDHVPDDYIRKQTLVNAERFITPELKEYEEKILGAEDKMLELEQDLFFKLREEVFSYVDSLQKTARALAKIDVLSSFAAFATRRSYCRPRIVESGLSIQKGRHPVIESLQSEPYIPNNLVMREERLFHLLTGPNMSGKSSYLRQSALIVLLAQIGSYVPAEQMEWAVVDRIFTRVGASDNLARGRSTFMVEMQEAAYILHHATENSLVILDELGRGTSTYDGLSLAWAITEYLHDVTGSKTLFATHYHELIEIVDELSQGQNFSVAVTEQNDGVVFLHQVLEGGIDRSYGIEVAKLAGMPYQLVVRAKDLLTKLEQHSWEQKRNERQPSLPLMPVEKNSEHPVIAKLKEVDPNNLTPIKALQLLSEWRGEVDD